jgi:DNA-binding NarL/FixJ family response regulator
LHPGLRLADLCIEINSDKLKEIYSIFVADNNTALLEGLVSIINQEPTFEVVGTASSKSELEAKVFACTASLFLLDIDLAGKNGLAYPENGVNQIDVAKTILLTEHWEHSLIKRIMASGVMGCLRKTCDASELIYAMNRVLDGNPYFSGYHHQTDDNIVFDRTFSNQSQISKDQQVSMSNEKVAGV